MSDDNSNDNGPPTWQDQLFEQSYPNAEQPPDPEPPPETEQPPEEPPA